MNIKDALFFANKMAVIQNEYGVIDHEQNAYRKVASSNMSCLEAHAVFFRLLMKEIFDPYVL